MATIQDIAAATGRSTATVDRVLNNRVGVRDETRRLVHAAADRLGYVHAVSRRRGFDIVLPAHGGFMHLLAACAQSTDRAAARDVRVHLIDYANPAGVAGLLRNLREQTAGIGVVALDNADIREALRWLIASHVPVVTMLTDITGLPHQGYVGVDNRIAGRVAGELIGRFLPRTPASVVVFTGSPAFRGHEEREMGFRSVLRERFAHLAIREVLETGEDAEAARAATVALLAAEPVAAIYNIGAGTAGIAAALERMPVDARPIFVAHDLSVDTRAYLQSGMIVAIIAQSADATMRRTIERLQAASTSQMLGVSEMMPVQIVLQESLPLS